MDPLLLGTPGGDRLVIAVHGRSLPGEDDYWDGNWLLSPIEIVADGVRTWLRDAGLRTDELQSFREELTACLASGGAARLSSLEEWIELTVAVEPGETVLVAGVARDPGVENWADGPVRFRIDGVDRRQLAEAVRVLEEMAAAYPVVGEP